MNTSRSAIIDQIIEKRKPLAKKIQQVEANLEFLADKLGRLEAYRQTVLGQAKSQVVRQRLEMVNISRCKDSISNELKTLRKLRNRFDRPTLNVGVIGRMGQGKSTLLQSFSGLTDVEIPARVGRACTAVRSVLYNHEGATQVSVVLHSEESFLRDVIHEYWQELGWNEAPVNLNAFAYNRLPDLVDDDALKIEVYKHLKDYHEHVDKYRSLLQADIQPREKEISKQEIEEYVTQQRDSQNQLTTFKHLAVKEAKINCCFSNEDVGKIALVDVPGLGDTKLGDEALMLRTLRQEVDVVLFVRRPDPIRYQWEKEDAVLYRNAARELNQIAQRAFMVLNHQSSAGDNLSGCKELQKTISFDVVECLIVDCSNHEASNQLLDAVLTHLTNPDLRLDEEYFQFVCKSSLQQIQEDVVAELEKARQGYESSSFAEEERVDDLFEEFWEALAGSLKAKLGEIRSRRNDPDPAFKKQMEETLQHCREDTGVPPLSTIQGWIDSKGGPQTAYELCLNEVRLMLSQKFISLDQGLKQSLDQAKGEMATALANASGLSGLSQAKGAEFLNEVAQQIPNDLHILKEVFQTFAGFDLLYRGMIQHRIRPQLDPLTPGALNCPQISKSPTAQDILETLEELQKEAVYNCEQALKGSHETKGLLEEPSQAVFAIAEEFVDGVLWAKDVRAQWKKFLRRVRTKVWSSEFEVFDAWKDWQRLIERVEDANKLLLNDLLN
ncbi:dynamin family protein [Leptolyngbya sp. FACHB-671]|uniref:dynamin family protein n=1 Tax=Leptolyngbya sp. FACHB-671 TaxID=2692812 RepID=UPI0016841D1A|nr:dynamin family protein [Leptolyngbya sp. FACHB-671]MBD1867164.1 dynamin family protein [Cyanobacteria bacterium FACHB-471]MBD2066482.1 dynamin family protein [Leptolyngbya sp. FACHB-671]